MNRPAVHDDPYTLTLVSVDIEHKFLMGDLY